MQFFQIVTQNCLWKAILKQELYSVHNYFQTQILVNSMNSVETITLGIWKCETGGSQSRDAENLSLLECYTMPTGK